MAGSAQNPSITVSALAGAPSRKISQFLLALIFVGALIAFIDGITTRYNDDWEYYQSDALTYRPDTAAIIFAVVTFPLAFQCFRKEHASRSESVLLWYLLSVTAYTKDFAYLKIPGIPFYVTDYVLGVFLVRYFVWPRLRWYSVRSWPIVSTAALLSVGCIAAARGVVGGQSLLLVARDFGLVVYTLFVPIGILVFRNWDAVRRVALAFCVGSAILAIHAIGFAMANPGQRRYIFYPVLLAGGFVASYIGVQNRVLKQPLGWFLTIVTAFGLLLANSRAEFVAVLGTFGLMFLFGPSVRHSSMVGRIRALITLTCVTVILFGSLIQTKAGEKFADRIAGDFLSGVLHPSEDPQAEFRFLAWAEAFNRFTQHPILGEGYGIPFTFGDFDTDVRPHNTYLTFLYKTGAIGFLVLTSALLVFFFKSFVAVRHYHENRDSAVLYMIGLALIAVSASGVFTLLFESPFVSAPYWLLVAAGYRSLYLLGTKATIAGNATIETN